MQTTPQVPPPTPRKMDFPFREASIPRHWFGGLAVPTHVVNGVNLLFPAGERFFVRSVKHYLHLFEDDPEMLAQIRGFFGQEGRHAREHERYFEIMEAQGFEIRRFLAIYERFAYGFLEKVMPPELRLASTAAAEHFTAIMAEGAFADDTLQFAHPVMRDLLLWHAAEEIEHKSVAYDVLQRVNPSYALRVAGLASATLMLSAFWVAATIMLIRQDDLDRGELADQRATVEEHRNRSVLRDVFAKGIAEYLRRDFHPWQTDNLHRATEYFAARAS